METIWGTVPDWIAAGTAAAFCGPYSYTVRISVIAKSELNKCGALNVC